MVYPIRNHGKAQNNQSEKLKSNHLIEDKYRCLQNTQIVGNKIEAYDLGESEINTLNPKSVFFSLARM